ncbi:MAG: CopG family transcriptional regulator [Terriglobia bacterium]
MASIKTAVSLQKPLFDQVEALAEKMNVPRSRIFALAVEEFVRRHQSQRFLQRINEAYEDAPDLAEAALRRRMRWQHRQIVEGEW